MPESSDDQPAVSPLYFTWILDCSSTMAGINIEALNMAITKTIALLRQAAETCARMKILVTVIAFSSGARWHVAEPTEIRQLEWIDLHADGAKDMGMAMLLLADALKKQNMPENSPPPLFILITDGYPTDDFEAGLQKLLDQPWGRRAVRTGIAIGDDVDLTVLEAFIGNPEIPPLVAYDARELCAQIRRAILYFTTVNLS